MRVLFVGDMNTHTNTFRTARALKELGHMVETISHVPRGRRPGISERLNLWTRMRSKVGYPPDETGVNKRLVKLAKSFGPDLIISFKAMNVRPATFEKLKSVSDATIAFMSYDNMAKEHNQNKYFIDSIEYFDTVFMARGYSTEFYYGHGAANVIEFDLGYDKQFIYSREMSRPYRYGVTFIGSYEDERHAHIEALANSGFDVHVWGNGWEGQKTAESLHVKDRPVYEGAYVDTMHDSKIVLNFFRKMNDDVMNSRVFEIPASRSFMVSESTSSKFEFFEGGEEAMYFDSSEELIDTVEYYLEHDMEREEIATQGYMRCQDSSYDYHSRLENLLAEI